GGGGGGAGGAGGVGAGGARAAWWRGGGGGVGPGRATRPRPAPGPPRARASPPLGRINGSEPPCTTRAGTPTDPSEAVRAGAVSRAWMWRSLPSGYQPRAYTRPPPLRSPSWSAGESGDANIAPLSEKRDINSSRSAPRRGPPTP